MRPARLFAALAVSAATALSAGTPAAAEVKGRPLVVSGDTLRFGREEVRLHGVDAPEQDQYCENEYGRTFECGIQAIDALTELIGRRMVTCVGRRRNEEGHLLSVCYAGDTNLNARMVRTGWAVARPAEQPDFASLEKLARNDRAGIWALKFVDPAEWRKQNP
jgi:endonuclease YncB( thermonuclease family)